MFGRFDRHRAHAAYAVFPRHLGILLVVSRVGVSELFQREWVLAREYADEGLALVFVVEVQVVSKLHDGLLRGSSALRLESVHH